MNLEKERKILQTKEARNNFHSLELAVNLSISTSAKDIITISLSKTSLALEII